MIPFVDLKLQHAAIRGEIDAAIRDVIDGVVVTFFEVTQLKELEQRALAGKVYAENIVQTVREPLLVLSSEMRVQSANKSFLGWPFQET